MWDPTLQGGPLRPVAIRSKPLDGAAPPVKTRCFVRTPFPIDSTGCSSQMVLQNADLVDMSPDCDDFGENRIYVSSARHTDPPVIQRRI
jgi:hypothetical protein